MIDYSTVLSTRASSLKPSGIRKFFDLLTEMKDVVSLGVGEPDFVTPWHIRDAGIYSLEKGFTKYSSNAGLSDLRKEISRYLERRMQMAYDPDGEILVTVGGSEAIDLATRALVNPGDEVIIPEPCFVCYAPIVTLAGGTPVVLPLSAENEFRISADQLSAVITPKSKLLMLTYPSNPTGGIMTKADLEAIAPVILRHNLMVISDEIYGELTYEGHHVSVSSLPGMRERTVVASGFSKAYSMTGWRLGYACAPREILAVMHKVHQFGIMCAPTTSQYAGIEAMRNGDQDIEKMKDEYNGRRRYLVNGLREIGFDCFEPKGAFYVFPSIQKTGLGSDEFCERLLLEEHVAVIAGNAFGESGEGFVRMCYAASMHDLETALERMRRFLNRL
ncbi:MAG: aminotransferase class I/II-fold pyridoxal phosphate-dependent enzyme [Oscillospiraceae bacterium]|nr:aminotransferase class I/II-fold pyridoxal phosphate-dependent enzyme [Oscillospiraceae bacterium]